MSEDAVDCATKMSPHDQLTHVLVNALQSDSAPPPLIVFCDRDENGTLHRYAGLARVRSKLQDDHQRGSGYPSILLLGLFPAAMGAILPHEKELTELLRWPGIAYLPYGFTTEQLIAMARRVAEGATSPLPPGILATPEDIRRVVAEIRHWLENRLRNTKGALIDFRNAARGVTQLHLAHLEPTAAISQAHRRMLDRLWAFDVAIARFAPNAGGLASVKSALGSFESRWQEFEMMRAEIRLGGHKECARPLYKAEQRLELICSALAAAIDATNGLSREMASGERR
jgi:hypothetical protein